MVTMNQPNEPAGSGRVPGEPSMTDPTMAAPPVDGQSEGMGGQAKEMAGQAKEAGQHVASVAKDEAGRVVGEAGHQVRDMLDRTRSQVMDEAGAQQERVATGLRSAGDELSSMGDSVEEPGMATQLVRAAGERTRAIAEWLEERDPGSIMDEARAYARRRPGMFLAIAAVAGIALGRITRAAVGNASESDEAGSAPRPADTMGDVTP